MSHTIWVSKGEKEYVGGVLTETTGKDISGDTIVVALGTYWDPPDEDAGTAPDVDDVGDTNASRIVKKLIDDRVELGDGQQLWGWIEDDPEIEPFRLGDPFNVR